MNAHTNPDVKHDALYVFEATDSNPNGDPDNGGRPRVDLETGQGVVSDVSLKRKVRDSIIYRVEQGLSETRYKIFIRRGLSLNEQLEAAYQRLDQKLSDKPNPEHVAKSQEYMIENFFDVRMFGAVMSTGKAQAGKVTGPVTIGLARSVDPVMPMEMGITRTASTREESRDNASQMGNKSVVPYGLYVARVHYQPTKDIAVTTGDLELLWCSLATMFEITRSAARPDISARHLIVFSHDNPFGNAPARALFDKVKITKNSDIAVPQSYADYSVALPSAADLPKGVSVTDSI
ncbi:CRISPR-associated Csd2 family protein [Propionibacteriaceae bacterium ES.041]|uniref:type I-C CRISPR-associated protein Cas7/Csd2 n=1 Tax=Enemella evansiae TaxID=2016499 RepID=UPI000B96018B|nr:type I-C CRISPR-associated protein Cas7/Csd2 [Enemella evansiae]OYO04696.1 type I-C CRISPR-associated protein Cas7/Csd2 [Enemella evansiae]PFG66074.1 CRISPR-associated Csd2 family protein [Propionibacteriaceae bacterium ES.041]